LPSEQTRPLQQEQEQAEALQAQASLTDRAHTYQEQEEEPRRPEVLQQVAQAVVRSLQRQAEAEEAA
jgi:hypothetical protein